MPADLVFVLPFVLAGAALYSSVGHGGATIYLAILTLAGYLVAPLVTSVLILNILVAAIAFLVFRHAGHFRWRLLLPFVLTSVPMAYLGGRFPFTAPWQTGILSAALLLAALRFLLFSNPPRLGASMQGPAYYIGAPLLGAVLGFLAGATGIGGGIFLSPILVMLAWADVREAGNVSSAFIVLNSLAGLAAKLPAQRPDPAFLLPLAAVVVVGGAIGAYLGAKRLPPRALQVLLGLVLLAAAVKPFL